MPLRVETIEIGLFQSQSHLAIDEASGECAIIDTGESGAGIAEAVARLGVKPTLVLATHGHLDHVGGLSAVRRAFPDIPIRMNRLDLRWLRNLERQGLMFGVELEPAPPLETIGFFEEGEEIAVGRDVRLKTIFTPGHTEGGATFFEPTARVAFVGDTLFHLSVGRTDLPGGSFRTLLASIRQKLLPLGDDVRCHCGHGPSFTIGGERRQNPFVQPGIEDRLGDV